MRVGPITVNGRPIGTIDLTEGVNPYTSRFSTDPDRNFDTAPGDGAGDDGSMPYDGRGSSHGSSRGAYGSHATHHAEHKGRHGPGHFGGVEGRHHEEEHRDTPHDGYFDSDIPQAHGDGTSEAASGRVHGQFAAARDRAREELKNNPGLNEKAMHIFAGENPDPNASTALWEETINRAAVRGTSLEKELRTTSEGGYFAGWSSDVSPETRKVLERSRDRALNYSNISNYATDNASGGKAQRDRETGNFLERKVYNGEHFFSPDTRIPSHMKRWEDMVYESDAARAAAGGAAGPAPSSGSPRANYMSGAPLPAGEAVKVTTAGGNTFRANPESAPYLQGFVEDLEKAGAPIHEIGGHNIRNIAGSNRLSQHAFGNAIDVEQQSRNVVSEPFAEWSRAHPTELRNAINRWGIVSGGDWKNPDYGHFEWGGAKPQEKSPEKTAAASKPFDPGTDVP